MRHGKTTKYQVGGFRGGKVKNEIWMNGDCVCNLEVTEKGEEHVFYDTNMGIVRAQDSDWEQYAKCNEDFVGPWE